MLRKNYLFELIKTLDIHEKRYLISKANKFGEESNGYGKLIDHVFKMEELFQRIEAERKTQSKKTGS